MTRGWLSGVVRARKAQEDVARHRLAGARLEALSARRLTLAENDRIEAMTGEVDTDSALAFVAAASARQAAGATWAAARVAEAAAHDRITIHESAVVGAARNRRSVEKLSERLAAQQRVDELSDAQDELDDIASQSRAGGNDIEVGR
jgi:flagellar protein FliJ